MHWIYMEIRLSLLLPSWSIIIILRKILALGFWIKQRELAEDTSNYEGYSVYLRNIILLYIS